MDPEAYAEAVLVVVEEVPRGRVTTYGAIAERLSVGVVGVGGLVGVVRGPRQVGRVLSSYGGPVPWWRVVRADGSLPPSHGDEARAHYVAEGTPLRASGRIDMPRAYWQP